MRRREIVAVEDHGVERRGDHQIELRIEPECHADDGGDGERDDQSGRFMFFSESAACGLAERGGEGKSAAAPAAGLAAGDQPIGDAADDPGRRRELRFARDRRTSVVIFQPHGNVGTVIDEQQDSAPATA